MLDVVARQSAASWAVRDLSISLPEYELQVTLHCILTRMSSFQPIPHTPWHQITPLSLGSSASLTPSPARLKAKTTSMIQRPGAKESMGLVSRYL